MKVNKVLKQMDYKGQTAVLSAIFVLVGMIFLVSTPTEKALGVIHATASGECGPEGQTHPCEFTFVSKHLDTTFALRPITERQERPIGSWMIEPTKSGTSVTWSTTGSTVLGPTTISVPGDEKGSVTYKVGEETAVLSFENPVIGYNKCSISGIGGSCTAGKGQNAEFKYNLRSTK